AVTVIINATPVSPTVVNQLTYVGASDIEYDATPLSGHTLVWYSDAAGSTQLTTKPAVSTAVAGELTAYVAQQNNATGCISPIISVTVTVKPVGIRVVKRVDQENVNAPGTLNYTIEV